MFYIFNSDNKCVSKSENKIDSVPENCYQEELVQDFNIDVLYWDLNAKTFLVKLAVDDDAYKAKLIRNNLRNQIDMFLQPASTYKDELVSQENKDKLIQDSLLLARWPNTENWPNIPLPTLSDYANEVLTIPQWPAE